MPRTGIIYANSMPTLYLRYYAGHYKGILLALHNIIQALYLYRHYIGIVQALPRHYTGTITVYKHYASIMQALYQPYRHSGMIQ